MPLIVVDPDRPGGQVADQVVSLVDIFPTVLDLMGVDTPGRLDLAGDSLLPIVEDPDINWYDPDTGRGVALTTIDGAVSIRAIVPGAGDVRYTRYPDGTEELYNLGRDPDEHVNRLNYETGQGLTAADDALHATLSDLMDGQLAPNGLSCSATAPHAGRHGSRRDAGRPPSAPASNNLAGRRRRRHLPALPQRHDHRGRRRRQRHRS